MSIITPPLQDSGPPADLPAGLQLALLGKPIVRVDGREVGGFRTSKSLALLCYLATHPQPHSRQSLTGLLWSDDAEEKAQNSLRVTLSNLNKLLPEYLDITRLTIAFRTDHPYTLDLDEFEQLTATLSTTLNTTPNKEEADRAALAQAVALYRGDFLDDLQVSGAPLFEEWLATQRAFYRERMLAALETLAEAQLVEQAYTGAVQTLERLLVQEPWHEAAYRQLMTVYSRMGDFNRALAYYERCRAMLAAELDVTPMPETEALHERIQAARRAAQYTLPAEMTPFVGREAELAQLRQMLADPKCRLITICGLGGMGKSRLALALAREMQRGQAQGFLNGVAWIALVGLASSDAMPLALVEALHLPLSGQSTPQQQLLDFLHNKEMLLVLDNIVLDNIVLDKVGPHAEAQSRLIGQILAACPDVKVVATSREPLNLAAEWRFDLGGLRVPHGGNSGDRSSNDVASSDAVQLFVQAARQVRPSFQLDSENIAPVCDLCRLVGGMPLAIRLAAAWLRMMQVQEIVTEVERGLDVLATQMQDVPLRQRSMRAIFEQSWQLLTPQEQRVMCRLAIFRGGFRREAAERVTGATLQTLTVLMDRSLLQSDGSGRYFCHELLRQFAAEKLAEEPKLLNETRTRHARYYSALLDQQAKPMRGAGQRQAVATVAADIENIRLAWQTAVEAMDVTALDQSVDVLIAFYDMRGWYGAGIALLYAAVNCLQQPPTTPAIQALLAKLCVHLGWAYIRLGQYDEATAAMRRSQHIYEQLKMPPPPGLGTDPLVGLGVLANIRGDYAEAFRLGDEACRLSEQRGDGDNLQNAYAVLTSTAFTQGQYAEAKHYARQAYHYAATAGNQWFLAYIFDDLGMIESALGNYDEAAQYLARSYALREEFDDASGIAITSMHLAEIAMQQQRWAEANDHYERSLKRSYEINDRGGLAAAHEGLGRIAAAQGEMIAAQPHFHSALQIASQIGFTPVLLSILTSIADFLLQTNRQTLALTVLQVVSVHPSSSASTHQRAMALLATQDQNEGTAQVDEATLDALVTRLLVELAIPTTR